MRMNKYTKVALEAAQAGGAVLSKYFSKSVSVTYKGRIDPVTIADKNAQEAVFRVIAEKFPSHTLLGEEGEKPVDCNEYCWVVDPLDGTVNFVHGLPQFCTSVALTHNGKVIAGVVYAPKLGETFVAQKSAGAWRNGKRIQVSRISTLVRSLTVTGFPYVMNKDTKDVIPAFARITKEVQGVRRFGSAAMDLCYVAMGRFEAFWEVGLQPWDVAAGSLVLTEAGGKITDYSGGSDYLWGRKMLATNKCIHREMLRLICKK